MLEKALFTGMLTVVGLRILEFINRVQFTSIHFDICILLAFTIGGNALFENYRYHALLRHIADLQSALDNKSAESEESTQEDGENHDNSSEEENADVDNAEEEIEFDLTAASAANDSSDDQEEGEVDVDVDGDGDSDSINPEEEENGSQDGEDAVVDSDSEEPAGGGADTGATLNTNDDS